MNKMSKLFLAALGSAALFAVPAQAATFNVDFTEPLVDIANPTADAVTGTVKENITASSVTERSPWDTTANTDGQFTAILGSSSARYDIGGGGLSFMWGSVDKFNNITFYSAGDAVVDTLTGAEVLSSGAGVVEGLEYANIEIFANAFSYFVIDSTNTNSFEFANLEVSVVPLPAALPLYGAGIAVLGFVGWRKRQKAAAAA